jgi:septal ring factor EnvC (AmiA/AmiB activator)
LRYLLIITILLFSFSTFSQNKKNLEKKKKEKQNEIEYTNNLLKQTRLKKTKSYNSLLLIDNQINNRSQLISTIEQEVNSLNKKIEEKNDIIKSLNNDLTLLKKEYARLIYYAWKNQNSYSRIMFILSSKDFAQAYKRMQYLQQYTSFRKKQADAIKQIQGLMADKIQELNLKKREKQSLINSQQIEKEELSREKIEKDEIIKSLKLKEQDLSSKLQKQKSEAALLQQKIAKIIEEEARKAIELAAKKAKERELAEAKKREAEKTKKTNKTTTENVVKTTETKKTTNENYGLTPEDNLISTNFGLNKGHLPWPTERGVVTSTYGRHQHPILKDIITMNDGIDITTTQGSFARSIFDGEVIRVINIADYTVVMIKHGEYYSVYTHLTEVLVSRGDKVKTKQKIGKIYTDTDENKTTVQLQIWKKDLKLNPSDWILSK